MKERWVRLHSSVQAVVVMFRDSRCESRDVCAETSAKIVVEDVLSCMRSLQIQMTAL